MHLHVLGLQHDIVWEDKSATHALVDAMLDAAAPAPGTLVLLPELFDTGFSMNLDRIVDDRTLAWARAGAGRRRVAMCVGYARREADGMGRNCAALVDAEGRVQGEYRKMHPFSYGRESQHYRGGNGLLLRRIGPAMVCPLVCYDLRFPELWRLAAFAGAEVFLLGANWPAARTAHWRALCIARAIENQAFVVAVNRTGSDPHLAYAGGSLVVDPRGEVLAESDEAPGPLEATLDLALLRAWRAEFPALRDARPGLLGTVDIDRPFPDGPESVKCGGQASPR